MKKDTLTVETDEHGTIRYYNDEGELHNPHGPAVVYADGDKFYYINGKLHNSDGPAIVYANGDKSYYIKGKLHNPDEPAMVCANGYKAYFINGKELTETKFKTWQAQQSPPLHNKTATIDGIEYTLTAK
tara:strand:+ start:105 stop:491 length:387 start_codon:yes stop_codon:yes gene_type:complete